MTKQKTVLVAVSEDFHYDLDKSRRRTLPAGWRGRVEPDVATALKKEGKGDRVKESQPSSKKKTPAKKTTAKKAKPPKGQVGPSKGSGGSTDTSST